MNDYLEPVQEVLLYVPYFDLKKTAESGQCFRWKEIGERKYLIPVWNTCAIAEQNAIRNGYLRLRYEEGTLPFWKRYFRGGEDPSEDYNKITKVAQQATLANGKYDPFLRRVATEADGVQILTQPLWETLVSFIISQNNNIPRIIMGIEAICKKFGELEEFDGYKYYSFPHWTDMADKSLDGLGLGYRARYLEQLVMNICKEKINLDALMGMETEAARTYLKSIYGVGNKVADCVLLFGMHRTEVFPVDTWIQKVIDQHYGGKFPIEHYAGYAGIIQQFIFYYMQQHKGDGESEL